MEGLSLGMLVLTVVGSLVSGTLVGVVLNYLLGRQRLTQEQRRELHDEQRKDFELILQVVTRQRDEAIGRADALEEKIDLVELEVQGLRLTRDVDPFPHWIVDNDGRYIFVNCEFEREFLEPKGRSYRWAIGKRHEDLWGGDFAERMRTLDAMAKRRADRRAKALLQVEGRTMTIQKFPICVHGVPVAWAGYVTDIEDAAPRQ